MCIRIGRVASVLEYLLTHLIDVSRLKGDLGACTGYGCTQVGDCTCVAIIVLGSDFAVRGEEAHITGVCGAAIEIVVSLAERSPAASAIVPQATRIEPWS